MSQPEKVDVFICGSGSAGLCAATWLARCGIRCRIVDSRTGPMAVGQADGVQCRTVEVFDSFGIAEELLRESYHVLEVVFWGDGGGGGSKSKSSSSSNGSDRRHAEGTARAVGGIVREGSTPDTEMGLSRMPHVILNQARINALMLGAMERFNGQKVDYGVVVKAVEVDADKGVDDDDAYPVKVTTERAGKEEIYHAKYVLGCDGAHSSVRRSLGFKMIGDSSDSIWGVMDIYPRTNFPDIRKKAVIQSTSGAILVIPREGGSLCRFYIELPSGTIAKDVTLSDLQSSARAIFQPYEMDFADTFWWSAYSIGQRLADHFSKDNRIFLTGDACHTHSPKAGQGMNVSLQDGYNIGWKLSQVLKKQSPSSLLRTYNIEREKVAADLISFDRNFAKAFSSKGVAEGDGAKRDDFSDVFVKAGRYTAGLTAKYEDSMITRDEASTHGLATGLKIGMRFPSTLVVRLCDAKAMHLAKALPADGRWRVVIFPGDVNRGSAKGRLQKLADYLSSDDGPVQKYRPAGEDIDCFIEPIVVFSGERANFEQEHIPDYFWPVTGQWQMRDLHKTFVDDESYNSGHGHAYDFYGIDPTKGAVVIVRPDQYVSMVLDLDEHEILGDFFNGFCLPKTSQ